MLSYPVEWRPDDAKFGNDSNHSYLILKSHKKTSFGERPFGVRRFSAAFVFYIFIGTTKPAGSTILDLALAQVLSHFALQINPGSGSAKNKE